MWSKENKWSQLNNKKEKHCLKKALVKCKTLNDI